MVLFVFKGGKNRSCWQRVTSGGKCRVVKSTFFVEGETGGSADFNREGGIAAVYVFCVLKVTDSIKEFGQAALCYLCLDGLGG